MGHPEQASDRPGLLEGWLNRGQAAAALDVSVRILDEWRRHRLGPPWSRIGSRVVYREQSLREWLLANETGTSTGNGGAR